ncbi:hypothetical protein EV121DRAFT_274694, partial [Schizophyllum commune]
MECNPKSDSSCESKLRGRKMECHVNELEAEVTQLKRKLLDITENAANSTTGEHGPASQRRRIHHQIDGEESYEEAPLDGNPAEDRFNPVYTAGRRFGLTKCIWLKGGMSVFGLALDPNYDAAKRHEDSHSKMQGQLRDVLDVLPDYLRERYSEEWIGRAFLHSDKGLLQQCQNIKRRLRTECCTVLGVDTKKFPDPEYRLQFRNKIGFNDDLKNYHATDIPILHDETYSGSFDLSSWMRGTVPKQLYVALIRGSQAATHWTPGRVRTVCGETNERKFGVFHTTPEAMALTAVL